MEGPALLPIRHPDRRSPRFPLYFIAVYANPAVAPCTTFCDGFENGNTSTWSALAVIDHLAGDALDAAITQLPDFPQTISCPSPRGITR